MTQPSCDRSSFQLTGYCYTSTFNDTKFVLNEAEESMLIATDKAVYPTLVGHLSKEAAEHELTSSKLYDVTKCPLGPPSDTARYKTTTYSQS